MNSLKCVKIRQTACFESINVLQEVTVKTSHPVQLGKVSRAPPFAEDPNMVAICKTCTANIKKGEKKFFFRFSNNYFMSLEVVVYESC